MPAVFDSRTDRGAIGISNKKEEIPNQITRGRLGFHTCPEKADRRAKTGLGRTGNSPSLGKESLAFNPDSL
jgi:hypothetical protein